MENQKPKKFKDHRCFCPAEGLLGKFNKDYYEVKGKIGRVYSKILGMRVDIYLDIKVYKDYFRIRCPRCGRWHRVWTKKKKFLHLE